MEYDLVVLRHKTTANDIRYNPTYLFILDGYIDGTCLDTELYNQIKDCDNFITIPTKKFYTPNIPFYNNQTNGFFTDVEIIENSKLISSVTNNVIEMLSNKKYNTIVISNYGVGLDAKLPEKAPKTYQYLVHKMSNISNNSKQTFDLM